MPPRHHSGDDLLAAEPARALGLSQPRVKILAIAARDGSCTADGLMAELGISRSTLAAHIKPLEEAGLLVPTVDPARASARGGANRIVWAVDLEAIDRLLAELRRSITGEHPQT